MKPKPQHASSFSFDVWSLQIRETIIMFLSSLQIHLSTPSFFHYCVISCFPYTMSALQKQTQSLQELNPEKESWNIVARVVRLWFVEDYTKGKFLFSMEIVLQDKEVLSNARYFLTFPYCFSYNIILLCDIWNCFCRVS